MQYTEIKIDIEPASAENKEIITALLSETQCDSFMDTKTGVLAYIPTSVFNIEDIEQAVEPIKALFDKVEIVADQMPDVDWNAKWEADFTPICIANRCRIRAPFHQPDANFDIDIVIDPKMSFGTGHHATTCLMITQMLSMNLNGKKVLDMGCGTGVLAIAAEKLGAAQVTAIDIDEWSYKNAIENVATNGASKIDVKLGGSEAISGSFDVVLANINRNILLEQLPVYASKLNAGALVCLSGFYQSDVEILNQRAEQFGLKLKKVINQDEWVSALFCSK